MTVPADSYIIVHLADGTSNQTDLYAGSGSAGKLNNTEDRLSLFVSSQFNTKTLVDFVQWDDDGVLGNVIADNLAAAAGQWPDGDYVTNTLPGDTLGRDLHSADDNDSGDWENTYGADSGAPTPSTVKWTSPGLNLVKIGNPTVIYPGETVRYR